MAIGIPNKKFVTCKKCPGSRFKNYSQLRKHQWAQHTETFNNLVRAARKVQRSPAVRKKRAAGIRRYYKQRKQTALMPVVKLVNGDMRVSDLLVELKSQQRFMNDVVALVSGILDRHQEAQQQTKKERE